MNKDKIIAKQFEPIQLSSSRHQENDKDKNRNNMEELYRKVFIKSESDLPKEDKQYFVKHDGRHEYYWFCSKGDFENKSYWLKHVDWYIKPIASQREDIELPNNWECSFIEWDNEGHSGASQRDIINWFKAKFKEIEYPSEEDIYFKAKDVSEKVHVFPFEMSSFQYGAEWMREWMKNR